MEELLEDRGRICEHEGGLEARQRRRERGESHRSVSCKKVGEVGVQVGGMGEGIFALFESEA